MNTVEAISTTSIPIFQRSEGVLAEAIFERLAEINGWIIVKSTPAEDRMGWDFCISKKLDQGQVTFKVDVKSIKKISRSDQSFQDKYTWIELSKGKDSPGWLYRQATDVFAFETIDEFILVKRPDLQKLVDRNVDRMAIVTDKEQAVGKVFERKKFKGFDVEQLTLVDVKKIRTIAFEVWTKTPRMVYSNPVKCNHITSSESELHRKALESINFKSERLREKCEAEIRMSIIQFKYCPQCGSRLFDTIKIV
jgi:hypothetical protein